jgi:hypothetical protein
MAHSDDFTITVGSASFSVLDGRLTTTVNEPDTARGTIPGDEIAQRPVDWVTPAQVAVGESLLTTGQVVEAVPASDGSVNVSLQSALALSESVMPPMVCQNMSPQEIVYAAARAAGFAVTNINVDGLVDLAVEPMWVLTPLDGVRVSEAVPVGVVEFLDVASGQEMLRRFSPPLDPALTGPVEEASAFARVAVVASKVYDAEEEGLALIDTATAWATTPLRYSWSHGPGGHLQPFERAPTRATVERRAGVGVVAVQGPRRWWRKSTTVGRGVGHTTLAPGARWLDPPMPPQVAFSDREALISLQRAATTNDPVQRVGALWEAIEFYVGSRNPRQQFSRSEVDAIVERSTEGLGNDHATRVEEVLRQFLNQPPIMARLKHVLDHEGAPVTAEDLSLLARLRKERNSALHGATAAPAHDDIDRAVACMSRAIATRWQRLRL